MLRKQLLRTSALVAAASISTAAVADVKVSGYQEWNYLDAGAQFKSTLGSLTALTFSGSGDMDNGISYSVSYDIEDGDAAGHNITFDLGGGLKLGIGYDQSYGIETVKAISPYVNNRRADITGAHRGLPTAARKPLGPDVWDTSSGENAIGLSFKNDLAAISFGFTPVRDVNTSSDAIAASSATSSEYGTASSIGVKLTPVDGLTIGFGTSSEESDATANSDPKGTTIGFQYKIGSFAIGYQEIENIIDSASSTEDSVEIQEGGVAYKVNDALTIGLYAANMDYVTVASSTDNGVETGMGILQIGYNLGPAVIQYDYADGSDLNGTKDTEYEIHKIKVKVNF
jgi:outer membrane protein OmpU